MGSVVVVVVVVVVTVGGNVEESTSTDFVIFSRVTVLLYPHISPEDFG
jgi:hypothetical protein